jgi:lipoyl(octanoyl) transferase
MQGTQTAANRRRANEPGVAATASQLRVLETHWLGMVAYDDALSLQRELVVERRENRIRDRLLLLEHPHVITKGTSAHDENVLVDAGERALLGIGLFDTGRGGDVTYHGPGQLVGYPILDLKPDRRDLHRYVRDLEEVIIRTIAEYGITGTRSPGSTGVWVGDVKIAAIGVRVSSGWITSHGFALNVDTDLRYFDAIIPCGIRDRGVTSMQTEMSHPVALEEVGDVITRHMCGVFGRTPAEAPAKTTRKT